MNQTQKLQVLAKIAKALNRQDILWAAGGSLMLYLHGIAPDFHDLDLAVAARDAQKARDCLCSLGTPEPAHGDAKFATKYFYEFVIDGVEVDLLADFTILRDDERFCFPLTEEDVETCAEVYDERVPLQSLATWRACYALMGREDKVRLLDERATPPYSKG